VKQLERDGADDGDVRRLVDFIKASGRGVISKRRRAGNGDETT
jgi:hypothetical protein